jgi:hypothetical protein
MAAVDEFRSPKPQRYTARGHASSSFDVGGTIDHPAFSIFKCKSEYEKLHDVSVRTGILYELDHRDVFGLSFKEIPITAWELVPYSFVIDWFVNAGDYIQAVTPKLGVKVLGSWSTTEDEIVTKTTTTLEDVVGSTYNLVSPGGYTSVKKYTPRRS